MKNLTRLATHFTILPSISNNNRFGKTQKIVNPLRSLVFLSVAAFLLLTSSSLYAQNGSSLMPFNGWTSSALDSIVDVKQIDSTKAIRFWQSIQDSINGDSGLRAFTAAAAKSKHLNDSLRLGVADSVTEEQFSQAMSAFKKAFNHKSSVDEISSFGIYIRTNIPVAILSIPNSFHSIQYSNINTVSQGDGQQQIVSTFTSKPISYGFGLTYLLNKNITVSLSFDKGILSGIQDNVNTSLSNNVYDFKSFTNDFKSYGLSIEANPIKMFSQNQNLTLFNSWLELGCAYVTNDVKAHRCDGRLKTYQFIAFATTVGVKVGYSLTPSCNLMCGSTLYVFQTAYLDGVYNDNNNDDKMLLHYVGVSYQFGSASNKKHSFK